MRIIIQIPAYNEAPHLPAVIADILKNVQIKDASVTILVVDDGSTDGTAVAARAAGAAEVVSLRPHRGLGAAFRQGLRQALSLGADVIVNTDADGQYRATDIEKLVLPVLQHRADMSVGDRQIATLRPYPIYKYLSQTLGNWLASRFFCSDVRDATSGFRALSKEAALLLADALREDYTYTLESLGILLKAQRKVAFVPIAINPPRRPSRLITSKAAYAKHFILTLLRSGRDAPHRPA